MLSYESNNTVGAMREPAPRVLLLTAASTTENAAFAAFLAGLDLDCRDVCVLEDVAPRLRAETFDLLCIAHSDTPAVIGLIRTLRRDWALAALPIIVLTVEQETPVADEHLAWLEAGASEVMALPGAANRQRSDGPFTAEWRLRIHRQIKLAREFRTLEERADNHGADDAKNRQQLAMLIDNGLLMSVAQSREKLLSHILDSGRRLLNCDGATMYLVTEKQTLRFAYRTRSDTLPTLELPLFDANGNCNERFVSTYAVGHRVPVVIDDVYQEKRFDLEGTRNFDRQSGYRTVSMLCLPMAPRGGEVIGVLQFINAIDADSGQIVPFAKDALHLIEALAAQAAVALDNLSLVEAQKALMESMIRVIATAIDAKSPYTGRHCSRVPELAVMLAQLASASESGPLANFAFRSDEEWQEFRIGAWLHDCGKVTTPEYVIDKATKLESIHNKIHEIRTRFEVLLRDAQIAQLEALLRGESPASTNALYEQRAAALAQDYLFIAECNVGSDAMSDADVARLHAIGSQTWLRHFDDRIGLSRAELERLEATPTMSLPAIELLLADKASHIIARAPGEAANPRYGFQMNMPPHLYNRGELHNLSVRRGTLTEEERYKINEHVVATIVMLEQMRFPKSMQRVSEYAGTHHEMLNGEGYPRRLRAEQLSIPARIMAIADIFEALTAPDRPYKAPNKVSEAVRLLYDYKLSGQIDPDLFDLFLESGLYLGYARKYLSAEQIDTVDIRPYLGAIVARDRVTA